MRKDDHRVTELRPAYRDVFGTPLGVSVLKDLRRFCRADRTTFLPDDLAGRNSAFLEGTRQVLNYIEAMRSETDDLLVALLEI